jgi:integrase
MKSPKSALNQGLIGKKLVNPRRPASEIPRFTKEVEALKLPAPDRKPFQEYWHASDSFFGCRVMRPRARDGLVTRRWLCRHVTAEGEDRKEAFADAVLGSWEDARFTALKMRRESATRRASGASSVPKILVAFDKYRKDNEGREQKNWSPSTKKMWDQARKRLDKLKGIDADKVTAAKCDEIIEDIEKAVAMRSSLFKKEGATQYTGATAARSAMSLLHTVYNDLIAGGTVTFSPLAKRAKQGYFGKRKRRSGAISADDMPTFWGWLMTEALPESRDWILVAIFMAFRKSLVGSLTWDNVDMQHQIYRIPEFAEGNKTKLAIAFPIPEWIFLTVFKPRWENPARHRKWVIESPKHRGHPLRSVRGSLAGLLKTRGLDYSGHDFRRTGATLMHAVAGPLISARFLTHNVESAGNREANTAGYIIHSDPALRKAMKKMGLHALWLANGRQAGVGSSQELIGG